MHGSYKRDFVINVCQNFLLQDNMAGKSPFLVGERRIRHKKVSAITHHGASITMSHNSAEAVFCLSGDRHILVFGICSAEHDKICQTLGIGQSFSHNSLKRPDSVPFMQPAGSPSIYGHHQSKNDVSFPTGLSSYITKET